MRHLIFLAVALCLTGAAGPRPAPPDLIHIRIDDFAFDPADVTVAPGTTVVWTNRDDMPHTVTANVQPRLFASEPLETAEAFSYRFDRVGQFSYFCLLHPRMQGSVTVR